MSKRLDVNKIIEDLKKENYTPLFKPEDYVSNKSKLHVMCPEGHDWLLKYNGWNLGYRCPICSRARIANEQKIDIDSILAVEGYKRLSEYKNRTTPFRVLCNNNHEFSTTYNEWAKGTRCYVCKYNRSTRNYTYIDIKREVEKEGYKLLSTEFINTKEPLTLLCPNGHEWTTIYNRWQTGVRCKKCAVKKVGQEHKHSFEFVKSQFEKDGYELLSTEYNSQLDKLQYKCPKGHIGTVRFNDWMHSGTRCNHCAHHVSVGESEVYNLLKPFFSDAYQSDRTLISPRELDIVIPSKKIVIEYCGLYWHSEANGKSSSYHLEKLEACNKIGYRLITIFEDEWVYKNDLVKAMLLNKLGVSQATKIHGRKCEVKEIEASVKNNFLDQFHVQGKDIAQISLGAFYNNELVSVMTFSSSNIAHGKKVEEGVYELNRFCSNPVYQVTGISGKLLSYFIKHYNPRFISSYSDRRWSEGDLYDKLGFKFMHNSQPNYWYIVEGKRKHRYNYRKNVLAKKLGSGFNEKLTEKDNMILNGYEFVYDCGNSKWGMEVSN